MVLAGDDADWREAHRSRRASISEPPPLAK
jgi:hypothetical protein